MRRPETEPFYVNKWFTFAACATLQLTASLCYCFGVFSCQFKQVFQWNQSELTGFGTALNLGAFSAFIPGILYNALARFHSGPRICLALAAVQCVGGMYLIWGAATARFTLSYPMLLLAGFIFCNSNSAIDVVSVSCNVHNWPQDRGSAVGAMKSAVGLSASVFTILYAALQLNMNQFLMMCMLLPASACLVLIPFVNEVPRMQKDELMPHGILTKPNRFFMLYQVVFMIAVWCAISSVLMSENKGGSEALRTVVLVVLALLVASLWLVTVHSGGLRSRRLHASVPPNFASTALPQQDDLSSHPLLDMPWPACWRSDTNGNYPEASEEGLVREYEVDSVDSGDVLTERGQGGQHWDPNIGSLLRRPLLEEALYSQRSHRSDTSVADSLYYHGPAKDLPPQRIVRTLEFYLLFFVCFVSMGAALALLDNIPQLLASIVPSDWQSGATTNDSSSLRVLFTSGSVASDVSTRRHSIGTDTSAPNRPVLGGVFDGSSTSGGLSEHFDLESPAWGASHWMAGFSASTGNWAMEGSSNSIDGVGDDEGGCGGGGADGAALQRFGHTLLVIFSVFNTLGRILAGFWPEHSLHVHGTPRSFFCVLKASATAVWTLALLLTVWLLPLTKWATRLLGPITALAGLTFGASWTLMAVITSELFGMKYYAVNYATIQLAPMLATAVCPDLLVGKLYDQEQIVATLILMWRTRWVYAIESRVLYEMGVVAEHGSEGSGPLPSPPLSPHQHLQASRTTSNMGSPSVSSPAHNGRSHSPTRAP